MPVMLGQPHILLSLVKDAGKLMSLCPHTMAMHARLALTVVSHDGKAPQAGYAELLSCHRPSWPTLTLIKQRQLHDDFSWQAWQAQPPSCAPSAVS